MNAHTGSQDFQLFAIRFADWFGSYWAFLAALVTIAAWALSGPLFAFSDTWQGARTEMVNLKGLSDEELQKLENAFERLARFAARPAPSNAAAGDSEQR